VLVIAGNDMGFRDKVEAVIREKGVGDRVLFTGLLVGEEKLSVYRDADVLVYPAIHEIFGLVPFEAIMCGTPVIVTDDCGCGEIIGREGIGTTVRYGDVSGLRDKMAEVLSDRRGASEKVGRGRKFVEDNLSWERIGAEYERLYHECCVK
jgi:glycosyltransferase involved in cell wall biosynthesis